ncbi:hypothetical protein ABIA06_003118 [Bradyrhizobium yuanmingense]|uniref:hypothetical protein n=1 Tax=Bradyrhizobium yuanmingense TaxID=108015 RepID=UPI003511B786
MDCAELRASSPSTSQPQLGHGFSHRLFAQNAENDRRNLKTQRKYAIWCFCRAEGILCKARGTWQMLEMDFTRAEHQGMQREFPAAAEGLKSSNAQTFLPALCLSWFRDFLHCCPHWLKKMDDSINSLTHLKICWQAKP